MGCELGRLREPHAAGPSRAAAQRRRPGRAGRCMPHPCRARGSRRSHRRSRARLRPPRRGALSRCQRLRPSRSKHCSSACSSASSAWSAQPALRHRRRLAAGAPPVPGQDRGRRPRPSAAGAAAGGRRLSRCSCCSAGNGTDRRAGSTTPSASPSPSTGRARRWPPAVMAFPLMVRAMRLSLGAGRPPARSGGAHARRRPGARLPHHHRAADGAGHPHRRHPRLRPQHRRVRRDHHLRLQHSRRDAHAAARALRADAGARRRRRRRGGSPLLSVLLAMAALVGVRATGAPPRSAHTGHQA